MLLVCSSFWFGMLISSPRSQTKMLPPLFVSSQGTRAAPAQVWIQEQEVGHTPTVSLLVVFLPGAIPPGAVCWEQVTNTTLR